MVRRGPGQGIRTGPRAGDHPRDGPRGFCPYPGWEDLLRRILDDKQIQRDELVRLPIEDKLKVIALMQRRANAVRAAAGRPTRPEWPLEAVGLPSDFTPSQSDPAAELLKRALEQPGVTEAVAALQAVERVAPSGAS